MLLFSTVPIPSKPALVKVDVHVGVRGPFRFLVDTGAQSTLIQSELALELGLKPQFRVELVTLNGTSLTPGARLRGLVAGTVSRFDRGAAPGSGHSGRVGCQRAGSLELFTHSRHGPPGDGEPRAR